MWLSKFQLMSMDNTKSKKKSKKMGLIDLKSLGFIVAYITTTKNNLQHLICGWMCEGG